MYHKAKIIWETLHVAFHRPLKRFCLNAVQFCEMEIQHHFLPAKEQYFSFYDFRRNKLAACHIGLRFYIFLLSTSLIFSAAFARWLMRFFSSAVSSA